MGILVLITFLLAPSFSTDGLGKAAAKKVVIPVNNVPADSLSSLQRLDEFSDLPDQKGAPQERESIFPEKSLSLGTSHFTWGAEVGSSIDCTAHNMSTFDIDVLLGYKNPFLQLAGVGVGVHRSIYEGTNYVPLYAVIRTDFRSKPSPCFMHIQGGYSFNTFKDSPTFGDISGSIGLGINLSLSKIARSYLIIGGGFRYFNQRHKEQINLDRRYVIVAKLSLGVNF